MNFDGAVVPEVSQNIFMIPGQVTLSRLGAECPRQDGQGYGAHSWLIGNPAAGDCKSYPGVPPDSVAMGGHWGQMVAMVPSREAVIVRLGWTFKGGQFDKCAFIAEVLKALPQ